MLAGGINASFENPGDDTNYSVPERFTRMIQRTAPNFPVAKKIGPNGDNGNHAYEGSFAYQFGRAMDIYQRLNEQPEAVRLTLDEDPSAPSVDTKPRDMYIGFAPQGAAENALVIPLAQQEQRAA